MEDNFKSLQNTFKCVILRKGDIVIDKVGNHIGILISKSRHIDMIRDDVYVWEVKWINSLTKETADVTILEEENLKLCIIVGTYEWHSVTGGTFEL